MEKTPNYRLSQWTKTDRILMEDFNADNARLEAALTALNTALGQKAAASALNSAKSALQTEDARLDSVKLEFVTLQEGTYTAASGTTQLNIPVNGPAIGQCIAACIDVYSADMTAYEYTLGLGPQNTGNYGGEHWAPYAGTSYVYDSVLPMLRGQRGLLLMFPMKRGDAVITTFSGCQNLYLGRWNQNYNELTTLRVKSKDKTAFTGTFQVRVCGIR